MPTGSASGLNTSFGVGVETTYGTPVTTDRFYEILSEDLGRSNRILQSNGMRAGARNLRRGSRRVLSGREGGGSVSLEVATTGFGRLFEATLGGTPTFVQQGATAAYKHTYQMGSLRGKSLTVQKAIRDADSTELESFTFHGCKVTSAEFSISVDQILQMVLGLDAEDVVTDIAMASPSYTTAKLFHFGQGAIKVAGSSVASVTNASVNITNNLKTDSFYIGSAGIKAEPQDNDFPSVTGSVTAEFLTPATFYDRFAADSGAELILEFVGDVIASTYYETLRITVPEVRFTGDTPKTSGPDVIASDVPFEGVSTGSSAGVKIEYITTDTTA